jgi:hypothetical protein
MTTSICTVEFEVITAGVINAAIFWDTAPCCPYAFFFGIPFYLQANKANGVKLLEE